jgi:ubiquitin C-terminal hydrolase
LSKEFYEIVKGVQNNNNNYKGKSMNAPTTLVSNRGRKGIGGNGNDFSPDNFKKVLGLYNSQFRRFEANDFKDLILYLFQTMHNELNYFGDNNLPYNVPPNQYNELNAFTSFMYFYNIHNFSIISNIFYGTYEIITQCLGCSKNIYDFQKFEFISFNMYDYKNKPFNIYDGFEDNQKIQLLKGDDKFFCNNCNQICEAKKCCKIIQPPNKLLIYIDYGKNEKYQPSRIVFDEKIDLTKYINFNFGMNIRYQIICVCTHLGTFGNNDHYIAFCRHKFMSK